MSDSTLDNLQQLFVPALTPGDTYDLRVFDAAATVNGGAETYGLAYSAVPAAAVVPEPSTWFSSRHRPGLRSGGRLATEDVIEGQLSKTARTTG